MELRKPPYICPPLTAVQIRQSGPYTDIHEHQLCHSKAYITREADHNHRLSWSSTISPPSSTIAHNTIPPWCNFHDRFSQCQKRLEFRRQYGLFDITSTTKASVCSFCCK